jgi:hypothetical protein
MRRSPLLWNIFDDKLGKTALQAFVIAPFFQEYVNIIPLIDIGGSKVIEGCEEINVKMRIFGYILKYPRDLIVFFI